MFTYAPPMSDVAHPSSLHLPPVFYGGTLPTQLLRPRLLSGVVQSVQFLVRPAAVDIMVDVRELSA